MIWENEQEIINELLYWQKRALAAEKEREEVLDELEEYIKMAAYFKQQWVDKDEELRFILGGERGDRE
jgi:L-lactate utilization protein LutB